MIEVETKPCLGCRQTSVFVMTEEQHFRFFVAREHVQNVFPDWSNDDRELLITGICPSCFEEMFPEEEEEEWYPEYEEDEYYDDEDYSGDLLDNSDLFEYQNDWYVD